MSTHVDGRSDANVQLNENVEDPIASEAESNRNLLQQQQHQQYELQQHRFQAAQPQLVDSTSSSRHNSGNSTPSHTRGHSNGRITHEHYSDGSAPINQVVLYKQQQQDLQRLQDEEQHQQQLLQNHLMSNGNLSRHPVYNTRIRHGFEADYESEQYMSFLAEVSVLITLLYIPNILGLLHIF